MRTNVLDIEIAQGHDDGEFYYHPVFGIAFGRYFAKS